MSESSSKSLDFYWSEEILVFQKRFSHLVLDDSREESCLTCLSKISQSCSTRWSRTTINLIYILTKPFVDSLCPVDALCHLGKDDRGHLFQEIFCHRIKAMLQIKYVLIRSSTSVLGGERSQTASAKSPQCGENVTITVILQWIIFLLLNLGSDQYI